MPRLSLLAACLLFALGSVPGRAESADETTAVRQRIVDAYHAAFVTQDPARYRALLTDDYLLLEHGELLDVAGDLALIPKPEAGYRRTDQFDFHQVRVAGDTAWAVYTLRSDITDPQHGPRHRDYLESAVLRRVSGQWRIALLHSTKLPSPAAK
ncbi:nuclear transport factor 2 family protein [Oleiharenicola sp. Vm1]|uniref:nuclear transport factor 2 family protein n=1 Tax=Oleiharenicola sp. Vm1 TaxID=3398393 RepID=UPI0039F4B178